MIFAQSVPEVPPEIVEEAVAWSQTLRENAEGLLGYTLIVILLTLIISGKLRLRKLLFWRR